jgi:hypothetical protein
MKSQDLAPKTKSSNTPSTLSLPQEQPRETKEYSAMNRIIIAMLAVYVTIFLVALVSSHSHLSFHFAALDLIAIGQNNHFHGPPPHNRCLLLSIRHRLVRIILPPHSMRNSASLGKDIHLLLYKSYLYRRYSVLRSRFCNMRCRPFI